MSIFSKVRVKKPRMNVFDLSHDVKGSYKFGYLYPCMVMETIPGDKFRIGGECLLRLMPLSAPVMHEMEYQIDYWYVPKRVLWEHWDQWIFDADASPTHPIVTLTAANASVGSLANHLGLPPHPGADESEVVSAFPFAAYQCIVDKFYRDQNLQLEINWKLSEGQNSPNTDLFVLRKRAWQHDYFTSCLPFAQKVGAVDIPIGQINLDLAGATGNPQFVRPGGSTPNDGDASFNNGSIESSGDPGTVLAYDPQGTLEVDATDITDLRRAFRLQEWRELAARVGTRIKEGLLGFFGVHSKDSRLDLPEFITSVKSRVNISEVLNNTGTEEAPQGAMAGHGIAYNAGGFGKYFCPEHGYIIGIMSVRPKTAYQQGIERHWLKFTDQYEHFWRHFEHIGEQAVKNKEVYAYQGQDGEEEFGYIPRYAEYKFMNSRVVGEMTSTLNDWHLGRIFSEPPALTSEFIECDPDANRVFAAGAETDYILAHIRHHVRAIRGMSRFGDPMI